MISNAQKRVNKVFADRAKRARKARDKFAQPIGQIDKGLQAYYAVKNFSKESRYDPRHF